MRAVSPCTRCVTCYRDAVVACATLQYGTGIAPLWPRPSDVSYTSSGVRKDDSYTGRGREGGVGLWRCNRVAVMRKLTTDWSGKIPNSRFQFVSVRSLNYTQLCCYLFSKFLAVIKVIPIVTYITSTPLVIHGLWWTVSGQAHVVLTCTNWVSPMQPSSCDCGQRQTMNHIVDTCPFTKFESRLNLLPEADDDAVIWLESTATAALAK